MNIEVTVKDIRYLSNLFKVLEHLKPSNLYLTDKNGMPDNISVALEIQKDFPSMNIIPHYSMKNHTRKNPEEILEIFEQYIVRAIDAGIHEILIVSGSPKPKFDSLKALEFIKKREEFRSIIFSVAYNPFLTGEDLLEENSRLEHKLKYPFVQKVCLQIGTLFKPLKQCLSFVHSIREDIKILPAVIIPTSKFLSKFREKPWRGVVLDDKYLSNLGNAQEKTQELLSLIRDLNLDPIIEIPDLTTFDHDYYIKHYSL